VNTSENSKATIGKHEIKKKMQKWQRIATIQFTDDNKKNVFIPAF
jgi:hypothetical protein